MWKTRTIRVPAGGQQAPGPKGRRWYLRPSRDARTPLTLTIRYRGGPECWYEVKARGSMGRFPGHAAIHDVMREINRTV